MPITVSNKPGTSLRHNRSSGLPSNIIHKGMVPMTSTGKVAPVVWIASDSSR